MGQEYGAAQPIVDSIKKPIDRMRKLFGGGTDEPAQTQQPAQPAAAPFSKQMDDANAQSAQQAISRMHAPAAHQLVNEAAAGKHGPAAQQLAHQAMKKTAPMQGDNDMDDKKPMPARTPFSDHDQDDRKPMPANRATAFTGGK